MKDKIKISIIIQARINSKRFKAKVLQTFGPYNIIEFIQNRFLLLENDENILGDIKRYFDFNFILAIPYEESKYFFPYLSRGFNIVEGDHYNVLQRFYDAFVQFEGDYIIRATGDNPYFSLINIKDSLKIILESLNQLDIKNNNKFNLKDYKKIDYIIKKGIPLGTGVEIISKEAFLTAYNCSTKDYEFEHVTPYIYENSNLFNIFYKEFEEFEEIKNLRLTFDHEEDFEVINYIGKSTNYDLKIDLYDIKNLYLKNKIPFNKNVDIKQKSYKEIEIENIKNV
jgi:spore coat polysaccharide biosynthesis protein SpsF